MLYPFKIIRDGALCSYKDALEFLDSRGCASCVSMCLDRYTPRVSEVSKVLQEASLGLHVVRNKDL